MDIEIIAAAKTTKPTPNADILGYRFEYIPQNELDETKSWITAKRKDVAIDDAAPYSIAQLIPDTPYVIRTASRNAAGFSDWTETKVFSTQPHGISSKGCMIDTTNILLILSLLILINLKNWIFMFTEIKWIFL